VDRRVIARSGDMLDALERLVVAESPSSDQAAVTRCAGVLADLFEEVIGRRPSVSSGDHPVVRLDLGTRPRVLLLGHFDTVWPAGTIERWPFRVDDGIATGPGVFDMKAGIVQGLFALRALGDVDGVTVLLTSDEELGSPASQGVIEEVGAQVGSVLVLEPAEKGALKLARKGCSTYEMDFAGRAAHAGLDPHAGANALVALARAVSDVDAIGAGETTVTPTVARAGTTINTVPAAAKLVVDVRAWTLHEQQRVDAEMRAIAPRVEGVELRTERVADRPPLERSMAEALFVRAQRIAATIGIGELSGVEVGGGSDGNFTAALGTPTLDGLGAVGDGAHAEGEHIVVDKMAERAALVAALIEDLLGGNA
jgi:glutamate carboxypeptidase